MQSEAATDKLTSVLCSIFEQNPDIPDGKTTYGVRKSFDSVPLCNGVMVFTKKEMLILTSCR